MKLSELKRLDLVATARPWESATRYVMGEAFDGSMRVVARVGGQTPDSADANTDLIAALRNALPDLIAAVEALQMVKRGLDSKMVKSKPIIQYRADGTKADMVSLNDIVDAALAKFEE